MSQIAEYGRQCKDTIGRLKRVYLAEFVNYDESQVIKIDGELIAFPDTLFYTHECEGNYNQNTGMEGGDYYYDQELSIRLINVYGTINPVVYTRVKYRIIAETNNGTFLMFGLMNGMTCEISNTSGTDKPEFNGFEMKFKGKEDEAAILLDESGFHTELTGLYYEI